MPQPVHLQYNSPLELYSNETAQEEFVNQIGEAPVPLPAGGNKHFDPSKSATLKYIQEGDKNSFGDRFFEKVAEAEASRVPMDQEPQWAEYAREMSRRARSRTPGREDGRHSTSPYPPTHDDTWKEHQEKTKIFTDAVREVGAPPYWQYEYNRPMVRSHSETRSDPRYQCGGMDFTKGLYFGEPLDYVPPRTKEEKPKAAPGYELGGSDYYKGYSFAPELRGHGPDPPRKRQKYTADPKSACNVFESPNLDGVDPHLLVGDTISNQKVKRDIRHPEADDFGTSYAPPGGFKYDHIRVVKEPSPPKPVVYSLSAKKDRANIYEGRSSAPPEQTNVWIQKQADVDREIWYREPNWRRGVPERCRAWEIRRFELEHRLHRPNTRTTVPRAASSSAHFRPYPNYSTAPSATAALPAMSQHSHSSQQDNQQASSEPIALPYQSVTNQAPSSNQQFQQQQQQYQSQQQHYQPQQQQQQFTTSQYNASSSAAPGGGFATGPVNMKLDDPNLVKYINTGFNQNQIDYAIEHAGQTGPGHFERRLDHGTARDFSQDGQQQQQQSYDRYYSTETHLQGGQGQTQGMNAANRGVGQAQTQMPMQQTHQQQNVFNQGGARNEQQFQQQHNTQRTTTTTTTIPVQNQNTGSNNSNLRESHFTTTQTQQQQQNREPPAPPPRPFPSSFPSNFGQLTSNFGNLSIMPTNLPEGMRTYTTQESNTEEIPGGQRSTNSYRTEMFYSSNDGAPPSNLPSGGGGGMQMQMMHSPGSGISNQQYSSRFSRQERKETTTTTTGGQQQPPTSNTTHNIQVTQQPVTRQTTYSYSSQPVPSQNFGSQMQQSSFTKKTEKVESTPIMTQPATTEYHTQDFYKKHREETNTTTTTTQPAPQPAATEYRTQDFYRKHREETRREETSRPVSQISNYSEQRNYNRNFEEKTETRTVPAQPTTNLISSSQSAANDVFNRKIEMDEKLPHGSLSNTHSNTQGGYKDQEGYDVSYKKDLQTSSDPGRDVALLKEEERRVVDTPLEPGVISRHVTTKYYKKKTVTDTQTTQD
ncbi:hypothetical protein WR25_05187 [Diploscapter pachys]|uniref:Zasp-like motif domain-containing protein n=1 Tax=Diploscapter pachys TaxID=2018661 RepID=A0A2A2K705_9BILA|nr:hypothetical protein WR25_05187 [Diploscapter pachys]